MTKALLTVAILSLTTAVEARDQRPRHDSPVALAQRLVRATDAFYRAARPHEDHNRRERRAVREIYQLHAQAHDYLDSLRGGHHRGADRHRGDRDWRSEINGDYRRLLVSFRRSHGALAALNSCDPRLERSYQRVEYFMYELIDVVDSPNYGGGRDGGHRHYDDVSGRASSTRPRADRRD